MGKRGHSQVKILVVDDEKNYRIILSRLLTSEGYQVFLADDPKLALEILQDEDISLVISDLRLERMDGISFCRQIHNEIGDIPCIVFSAYASAQCQGALQEVGIIGYLSKPFDNQNLLNLISKTLELETTEIEG
ncbi:MAG: response regulator [Desulfuromusa sp.]|jgi:CheY-like chemotaxis protein|nr:response regulator [Desulfuromusa sp.]